MGPMFTYASFAAHREPAYPSCGDKFNSLGHPINPC
jgi:bacteriocin-like protein